MCDHPLYTRALHALADHDYVGAIQLLSTTLSEVSTKHATHVRGKLGSAYLQQAHWVTTCFPLAWSSHDIVHNLHQARQHMECAISQAQFGDVAFLHTELADLHMVQLNYAEAIEHARQGLACASTKWIWLKAQCLMHYASFLQKGHEGTTARLDALALQTRPWGSPYTSLVGFYLALAHYHRGELDDAEFIFAQDDMRALPDVMRVRCYQMLQRIYVDQGVPWRCMVPLRSEVDALLRRNQPVDILFGRLEQCVADMFANYAMTAETVSGMLPHLRYIREALTTKARLHPVSTITLLYFEEVFCVRSGDLLSALMAVQEQRLLLRAMGNTDETRLLCLLGVISNAPVAEVSRLMGTIRTMCTACSPPGFVVEMISELERRVDSCDTSTASFETAHEHHHDTDDDYSTADSLNVCVDMDGSSSVDSEEQPAERVLETPERDVDSKAVEPTRPRACLGLSCHMVFDREKLRPTRIERVSPPRAPTDIDVDTFVLRVLKVRQVAQITDEKLSEIMRQIRERGYPPLYVRLAKVVLVERTSPKEAATGYVKLLEAEDMRRTVMSRLLQLLKKECRVLIQDHACWPVLHEAVVTLTAIMATKPCCEELVGLLFDVAVHIVTDCGRLSDDGHPAVYHPITSVNMLMLAFRDKPTSTPLLTFKHKHLLNVFKMFVCRHVAPRLDKQTSWLVLNSPSSKDLSVMRGRMVRVAQELMVHANFKAAHSLVHIVLANFPGKSEVMARDLAEFLLLQYDRSTRCAPEFMGSTMPTLPLAHLYVEFPDTTEQVFKAQQQIIRRPSTGDLVGLHHLIKGDLRLAWDAWGDDHPSSTMLRAFLLYAAHKRGVDEVVQEHMAVLKVRANGETELSRMVVGSVLSKIDTADAASLAESVGGDIAWPLMSVKLITECRHTLRIEELEA